MLGVFIVFAALSDAFAYAPLREPDVGSYNDASILTNIMERINRDMSPNDGSFLDFDNKMDDMGSFPGVFLPGRSTKDAEFLDNDYDVLLGASGQPSIRDQEYMRHSTLYGHNNFDSDMGSKILKAKGQEIPEVKTDSVLPAYCNPPNPCPVGYTEADGCIEVFENTAAFSRAYQASQDCMCDTEHMFDCPSSRDSDDSAMELSRQSFLADLQVPGEHKSLVAKKFYNKKKSHEQELSRLNEMAREAAAVHDGQRLWEMNPYLQGEKLPIAAKKGNLAALDG